MTKELSIKAIDGIIIKFVADFDGAEVVINDISITAPFALPYKNFTGLEIKDGVYKLYWISQSKDQGYTTEVHNYYNDKNSDKIAAELGRKKEECDLNLENNLKIIRSIIHSKTREL